MLLQADQRLEADLAGAASPNPHVAVTWMDVDQDGDEVGRAYTTVLVDTTDVIVLNLGGSQSGDGELRYRKIQMISLFNADNATITAKFWIDDQTNERTIFQATLLTGECAVYTQERGWHCTTTAGALKQVGQVTGATLTRGYIWVGNSAGVAAEVDGGAAGGFFVSDGNDVVRVAASGDVTSISGAGAFVVNDCTVGSDAEGDLLYKNATPTAARLGIGNPGETLRVNTAGTAPEWTAGGGKVFFEDFEATATTTQLGLIQPDGTAFDGTADVLNHIYTPGGNILCVEALGAGQTLTPAIVAGGLDIGGDAADNEGYEVFSHFLGATGRPFIAQVDAAFYFRCAVLIGDVSDTDDLQIGFRRAEICRPNWDDYTDAAAIGMIASANPAEIQTQTILNNGATGETDTTDTLADATRAEFAILVDGSGVTLFQHDIAAPGTLAAPTAAGAFTFDAGDPVIPFIRFLNAGANDTDLVIDLWDAGYGTP